MCEAPAQQIKYNLGDDVELWVPDGSTPEYIISLCRDDSFGKVVAGITNGVVRVLDVTSQKCFNRSKLDLIQGSPETNLSIIGVKFLDESSNSLLVGYSNGMVKLYDLRTTGVQSSFFHFPNESPCAPKTAVCFDRNRRSNILCVGTEQHQDYAYLLFYDIRQQKTMGAFYETHEDDVTSLKFHPENPNILCSGSTDGLINIFDLNISNEDDALLSTINTESSVHKLKWHKDNLKNNFILSCITHTNDLQLYEGIETDLIAKFNSWEISKTVGWENEMHDLIDVHDFENGDIFFLTSHRHSKKKSSLIRSLCFRNKEILPHSSFQRHSQIVRESLYDPKSNIIVTAGETGIVSLWKPNSIFGPQTAAANSEKNFKRRKFHCKMPPCKSIRKE